MKKKLMVVGAFPRPGVQIYGGVVTSCRTLLDSSFSDHYEFVLIDSTQISNPPPSIAVRCIFAFKRTVRFVTTLLRERPDAVLLFTSGGSSLLEKGAMSWLVRMRRVPVFLFPRAAALIQKVQGSFFQRVWVVAVMRGATHILCQGPAWQRFAIDVLGYSQSTAPIIQNWTATKNLLTIGGARNLESERGVPRLLFLGWLERAKGCFELLEACLLLSKRYEFRLTIAGRGYAENEARDFVFTHGLEDIIEFAGWVQGDVKDGLLAKSDILVLPSWAEGFPNVIVEAMAAKLAVIVTTVGNVPGLIVDREQAFLVPPKDHMALASAIEELLLNPELRIELADRGYDFARNNFSVDQAVVKLIKVIDTAITERG